MNSTSRKPTVDVVAVERALRLVLVSGQVTELRAFDVVFVGERYTHKTVSGYFDDPKEFAKSTARIASAKGIYFVPNVVNPALLSRARNRIRPVTKEPTTADHDIVARRYLLIDCDAVRPSGISSTDAEHSAAIAKVKTIRETLNGEGWPDPILADSGNGGHLKFRVDLSTDDGGLVERILHALQVRFGDDVIKVDTTVHNPARIWKMYGTLACKGDNTNDRPHRMSGIIDSPEALEVVPMELLRKLADQAPKAEQQKARAGRNGSAGGNGKFELPGWIVRHNLDVTGPEPWKDGGRLWVLKHCPWSQDHADGAYIVQHANGAIAAGCHHDSCKTKDWYALRDVAEPGWNGEEKDDNEKKPRKSQADKLIELAAESGLVLFHSPGGDPEAYVTIPIGNHHETMRVWSKAFRTFLCRQLWNSTAKAPAAQSLQDALGVLAGQALFEGEEHPVAVRLAEHDRDIFLDLANQDWQAVRVSAEGWEVVTNPPVRFIRPRGVLPLPLPAHEGRIDELREYVNVASDADFFLLVACIIAYLRPQGPFPLLAIYGEQGSAKSTATRIVRELVDPNVSPLRSEPREARDLMIAASNGWVVALENLSSIPPWLSDALCRLSTGGGFGTRELYSDGEEKLFDAKRPVLLNGIVDVVTRPDLADRAVAITLPSIPENKRLPESEFWPRFYEARPRILGALLTIVTVALRNLPTIRLERLPRMADFALWSTAAEMAIGVPAGTFIDAYTGNRATLNETALESCSVVPYLSILIDQNPGGWNGTAAQLLEVLNALATNEAKHPKDWPSKPNMLSGILRRIAPNLRQTGVTFDFDERDPMTRRKLIKIRTAGQNTVRTIRTVQNPENASNSEGEESFRDRSGDHSDRPGSFEARHSKPEGNAETNGANDQNDESRSLSEADVEAAGWTF